MDWRTNINANNLKSLPDKEGKKWCSNKDRDHADRDIMEDFFWTSSFEFSEIIGIRYDRESRSFCLDHHEKDDDNCENGEKNNHKNERKIARILWDFLLFANFWLFSKLLIWFVHDHVCPPTQSHPPLNVFFTFASFCRRGTRYHKFEFQGESCSFGSFPMSLKSRNGHMSPDLYTWSDCRYPPLRCTDYCRNIIPRGWILLHPLQWEFWEGNSGKSHHQVESHCHACCISLLWYCESRPLYSQSYLIPWSCFVIRLSSFSSLSQEYRTDSVNIPWFLHWKIGLEYFLREHSVSIFWQMLLRMRSALPQFSEWSEWPGEGSRWCSRREMMRSSRRDAISSSIRSLVSSLPDLPILLWIPLWTSEYNQKILCVYCISSLHFSPFTSSPSKAHESIPIVDLSKMHEIGIWNDSYRMEKKYWSKWYSLSLSCESPSMLATTSWQQKETKKRWRRHSSPSRIAL